MIARLFLLSVVILPAKSQEATMPLQRRTEFEVASIKPSAPPGRIIGCRVYPGGRVVIGHSTLRMLIEYATDEAQPDVTSCIVTSLQGIGLKLKPSQGPVESIVIEHAEKPSAN